ncbi:MAG: YhcB family protein [Pseudomonadales bacterium]|nr:YhcB family protein [Pseudomonadales bacterium]
MGWIEIVSFLVGALSGATICYFGVMRQRTENAVERQMRELQEEFTAYRENVNQHFHQTANLVNDLSANYISVQKHLETAATSFAEPPRSFDIEEDAETLPTPKPEFATLEIQTPTEDEEDAEFSGEAAAPPRDYAPKDDPKEQGTLDEGFRLQDQAATPPNAS